MTATEGDLRLQGLKINEFMAELRQVSCDEADGITDIPVDDLLVECIRRLELAWADVQDVQELRKKLAYQTERCERWQQDYDKLADLYNDAECFIMDTRHFPFPHGVEVKHSPVGTDDVIYEEVFYEVDRHSGIGVVHHGPPTKKWEWENLIPPLEPVYDSTEAAAHALYVEGLLKMGLTKKPKFTDFTAT